MWEKHFFSHKKYLKIWEGKTAAFVKRKDWQINQANFPTKRSKLHVWADLLHYFSSYLADTKCCVSLEMHPGNTAGAVCKKDCNQALNSGLVLNFV